MAHLRVHPQNTSRSCRACGHIAQTNRESQAVFCCESCGFQAHADRNAAENILARALLAPTPGPGATGTAPVPAEARRFPPPAAGTTRVAA
ncbi:MAG: transposase [Actinomycetota bacterium]|nr:transposase [Actinomycetota bacterium]